MASALSITSQPPALQAWVFARLSRGPERSVLEYVSTGPQRKRSQNPKSAGLLAARAFAGRGRKQLGLSPAARRERRLDRATDTLDRRVFDQRHGAAAETTAGHA